MSDSRRVVGGAPATASGKPPLGEKPTVGEKSGRRPRRGNWEKGEFLFNSEADEAVWRRDAYRQSINHQGWQNQKPVDDRLQATFDSMPELAEGRYFRGPDDRHRPIGREQREAPEVEHIRRRAFTEFANTGVTWNELGEYPADKPHPGEEEAIAFAQSKPPASNVASSGAGPNKMQDMGALPEKQPMMLHPASDTRSNLSAAEELWTGYPKDDGAVPVLVANNSRINPSALPAIAAPMPKYVQPGRPTPSFERRHAFTDGLVARPANDNVRSIPATGERSPALARGLDENTGARLSGSSNTGTGAVMQAEPDPEFAIASPLFNWRRDGKQAPSPAAFAIYTVSDEGRFTYLEDRKDEWSQQLSINPEAVFQSMISEVEKLSVAAQRDFHTSHHRPANEAEIAEINDAVEQIVFAPAERWGDGKRHLGGEVDPKPYIGIVEPVKLPGSEISEVFLQAAQVIAQSPSERVGGRPGNSQTRNAVVAMVQKLAAAIKACGGNVTAEYYGEREKFLPAEPKKMLGGSYADAFLPFTYREQALGIFANHASTYRDRVTLKPNEADQLAKLASNIAKGIEGKTLEIDAAGIGYFSKQKPNESLEKYLQSMDEFVARLINCKRPFLMKIKVKSKLAESLDNKDPKDGAATKIE